LLDEQANSSSFSTTEVNMALSTEKTKDIAVAVLLSLLAQEGKLNLDYSKIKRGVNEAAKRFGFTKKEIAEFMKMIFSIAYAKTELELDKIIEGKVEE
jgi:uncharacterized protein YpuA (DUF1002 family)